MVALAEWKDHLRPEPAVMKGALRLRQVLRFPQAPGSSGAPGFGKLITHSGRGKGSAWGQVASMANLGAPTGPPQDT